MARVDLPPSHQPLVVAELRAVLLRLRPTAIVFLLGMGLLSVSRLGLALWHHDQVSAAAGWGPVLLQGLRVDVASLSLLLGPAIVIILLLSERAWRSTWFQNLSKAWLVAVFGILALMELATVDFLAEYGLRPNRVFVEYLVYPREVAATLLHGHGVSTALTLAAVLLSGWGLHRLLRRWPPPAMVAAARLHVRLPLAVLVLLVAALGVRSTLGHRPLNPAMVAFSTDATVNSLPLNSFYSVAHAARDWLGQQPGSEIYGDMPYNEVVAEVRREAGLAPAEPSATELPTLASHPARYHGPPRNLVIVLEESLGAQFVGSLGGRPLTPNLDHAFREGWAFDRLYATGTRSVRGIEAVLTGFTPTPADAVVKRPEAQQEFFTLAELLRRRGYDTTFYYGGESHFDNMRGFFLGNGFQRIIDQDDYPDPVFVGSWGVSDEDLFAHADQEFRRLHAAGTRFFGLVFTSSNHDPFEFPDGRIRLYEQPKATRNNAAKYADHALGTFLARARGSEYWKDTVFLLVADHDSRVFGADLVPVENFHIPGVILAPGIAPRHDTRVVSQIDLPPTLLSLIGIEDPTPMIGRDLTDPDVLVPGRAIMQYDRNFALMEGDRVVVLQPGRPASGFRFDTASHRLSPAAIPEGMEHRARATSLWGSIAYDRHLHRLPAQL